MLNAPPPFARPPMQPMQPMAATPPMVVQPQPAKDVPQPPELGLPRFLNYYADYSGCGHWRMIWPEQVMNAHNKAVVHGTTFMNGDGKQYLHTKGVRVQRQATPE